MHRYDAFLGGGGGGGSKVANPMPEHRTPPPRVPPPPPPPPTAEGPCEVRAGWQTGGGGGGGGGMSGPGLRCMCVCVAGGGGGGNQQFSVYYLFILNFPTLNCLQFKPKLFSFSLQFSFIISKYKEDPPIRLVYQSKNL